jgi:GntR family transcriptional regulator / MocR family aminotransferase
VCSAEQLVIVPSAQQVLDLVGRLTLDPGDVAWLEEPGYVGARAVLAAHGARLFGVPVDAQGFDLAHAVAHAPSARLVYVTPGRQAPLGVTLSLERRVALLAWARAHGALVIEDDYDSEYRYEGRPVPALQGLDVSGVVVHVGTFSKTLLPSLRLAYAVIPEPLLDRFLAAKSIVDRFTPPLAQAVLADFIEQGHFARHLRRMRELYAERRATLLTSLTRALGDGALEVLGTSAGLDLALRLPRTLSDRALAQQLATRGVEAIPLSSYTLDGRSESGLILGFAAFSPARLRRSVGILADVLTRR